MVLNALNGHPDFVYYNLGVGDEVCAVATVNKSGDKHISSIYIDFFPNAKIRGTRDSVNFEKSYTDLLATLLQTLDKDQSQDPQTYLSKTRMHPSLLMPDAKSPDHFVGKFWIHSAFWNANCNNHCQARISKLPPFVNHPLDFELQNNDYASGNRNNMRFPQCARELDFGLTPAQLEHRFDALCAQQGYPLTLQCFISPHEMAQPYLLSPRYPVVPGIIASASGRFDVPRECGHVNGFSVDTRPPTNQGGAIFKIDNRRFLQIASDMLESACPQFDPKEKAEIFSRLQMTQFANPNGNLSPAIEQRLMVGDIHFYFGATLKSDGRYLQFTVTRTAPQSVPSNAIIGE